MAGLDDLMGLFQSKLFYENQRKNLNEYYFDLGYTLEFLCLADNKLSVKSNLIFYFIPVNGNWNEMHWHLETHKKCWAKLGNQHPSGMHSFHFQTSATYVENDSLFLSHCSIQFKYYLKILLIWVEIKTGYSVMSWSCHLYFTVKENANNFFRCAVSILTPRTTKHSASTNECSTSLWMRQRGKLNNA